MMSRCSIADLIDRNDLLFTRGERQRGGKRDVFHWVTRNRFDNNPKFNQRLGGESAFWKFDRNGFVVSRVPKRQPQNDLPPETIELFFKTIPPPTPSRIAGEYQNTTADVGARHDRTIGTVIAAAGILLINLKV